MWVLGRSRSRNRIWRILALKYEIWRRQFFYDFPENQLTKLSMIKGFGAKPPSPPRKLSVGVSVGRDREPTETVEPITVRFGVWTRVGKNDDVSGGDARWRHLTNTLDRSLRGNSG